MALLKNTASSSEIKIKKVTSIGRSVRSCPKNKRKRRCWKRYRGQGKRR